MLSIISAVNIDYWSYLTNLYYFIDYSFLCPLNVTSNLSVFIVLFFSAQVVEIEEGFDTESLFLYVLVAAVLGLVLFGVYHLFTVYALKKFKKSGISKPTVEYGTSVKADLDLQWIPAEHLKGRYWATNDRRQ